MSADDRYLVRASRQRRIRDLSAATGLARLALREARLAPGEETPVGVAGVAGAEWFVYVLSGEGTVMQGDSSLPLAPGDFLGIPDVAGGRLRNTGDTELVCLCGGEKS